MSIPPAPPEDASAGASAVPPPHGTPSAPPQGPPFASPQGPPFASPQGPPFASPQGAPAPHAAGSAVPPQGMPAPQAAGSAWQPPPTGPVQAASAPPPPGTPFASPPGTPVPGQQGAFPPPPPGYPPHWVAYGQQPGWVPPPPALAPNGQPLASFLDRFLAYLIDVVVYTAVSLIWTVPFMIYWFNTIFTTMNDFSSRYDPGDPFAPAPPMGELMLELYLPLFAFYGITLVLGLVFTYLYYGEFQLRRGGQTIGKRVMKIRVIPTSPDATLVRGHMAKRWAIQFLAATFVPLGGLLDGLWQVWDKPLQQCLHDKVAATVVVKVG